MNCEQVEKLLSLEDGEARVDPLRLAEHLAECEACRDAHPEVAWMMARAGESVGESGAPLPAVELGRARRRSARLWIAAAAALLLGITAVGLRDVIFPPDPSDSGVVEIVETAPPISTGEALTRLEPLEPVASAAADIYSSSENTLTTWHDGRRITSTVERSVWRARPELTSNSSEQR